MRPKPFRPEPFTNDPNFIRDQSTGLIWHRSKYRTLYADTDRSAVVYHANYLRFFEFGRTSLIRDFGYPYKEIEASGFVYPIIDLRIGYYSPLYYDDVMLIHTRPTHLERVRLQFDYLITEAETGRIVCIGYTKHCALNAKGLPVAVDPQTIALWKSFPGD